MWIAPLTVSSVRSRPPLPMVPVKWRGPKRPAAETDAFRHPHRDLHLDVVVAGAHPPARPGPALVGPSLVRGGRIDRADRDAFAVLDHLDLHAGRVAAQARFVGRDLHLAPRG